MIALCGCDRVFGLGTVEIPPLPDSEAAIPIDAPSAPIDAMAEVVGCADATREAFTNLSLYPNVAGCGGTWKVPGLLAARVPGCETSGNSGPNGECAAADLCSVGWHICTTAMDVAVSGIVADCNAEQNFTTEFFATAQPSVGNECMSTASSDQVVGCGVTGVNLPLQTSMCAPLTHGSGGFCTQLSGDGAWMCEQATNPITNIVKLQQADGGVMCCKG